MNMNFKILPLDAFSSFVPQFWIFYLDRLEGPVQLGMGLDMPPSYLRDSLQDAFGFASATGYWA